jgi:tRNA (guanine37-N1)-methyltransferase
MGFLKAPNFWLGMQLDVVTLFPESLDWFTGQRHVRNAVEAGHEVRALNPRPFTPLSGRQVDDTPFGGGAGMVLRVDAMEAGLRGLYGVDPVALTQQRRVIALVPNGRVLDDVLVDELVQEPAITLLCGRYEGFDERILDHFTTDRISLGKYVLAGGELAAMVVMDAIVRKLPGALGHDDSAAEESFSAELDGDPEYPHYTRPAQWRGWEIPPVLHSGNHAAIAQWRREQSRLRGAADPTARLDR